MRGFITASTNQYVTSIEFFRQAAEILEWGREKFRDVPVSERGPIFDPTYIREVKRFYMTTLMEVR